MFVRYGMYQPVRQVRDDARRNHGLPTRRHAEAEDRLSRCPEELRMFLRLGGVILIAIAAATFIMSAKADDAGRAGHSERGMTHG